MAKFGGKMSGGSGVKSGLRGKGYAGSTLPPVKVQRVKKPNVTLPVHEPGGKNRTLEK